MILDVGGEKSGRQRYSPANHVTWIMSLFGANGALLHPLTSTMSQDAMMQDEHTLQNAPGQSNTQLRGKPV